MTELDKTTAITVNHIDPLTTVRERIAVVLCSILAVLMIANFLGAL